VIQLDLYKYVLDSLINAFKLNGYIYTIRFNTKGSVMFDI